MSLTLKHAPSRSGAFVASRVLSLALSLVPLLAVGSPASVPANVVCVDAEIVSAGNGQGWDVAFGELDDALDAAASSGGQITEIWVRAAQRAYVPGRRRGQALGDRTESFDLLDGVALFGGFLGDEMERDDRDPGLFHSTVLSGDRLEDDGPGFAGRSDNCYSVVCADAVGASARIDGFRIRGGMADEPGRTDRGSGAGFYLASSSPIVENCAFEENIAFLGSAMALWTDCLPLVRNCSFELNGSTVSTGAVFIFERSNARFEVCDFLHNDGIRAAALFIEIADPVFVDCRFEANTGRTNGGAIASEDGATIFDRCRFIENESSDAGAIYADGNLGVFNCLFKGNRATTGEGGAMMIFRNATIAFSTFVGNEAFEEGGAIWFGGSIGNVAVRDSILWANEDQVSGNATDQLGGAAASVGTLRRCCVEDLAGLLAATQDPQAASPGNIRVGNFSIQPRFRDAAGGDFRLKEDSPCIDAGKVFAPIVGLSGSRDLDGLPRAVNWLHESRMAQGRVADIGAYELQ